MSGINTRKCCCCPCGVPAGKSPRATVSGYTPACCPSGDKPSALYGTWTLSPIVGFGTPACTFGVTNAGTWTWTACTGGGTSTHQVYFRLRLADPSATGTGAWEWQLDFGADVDTTRTVFRGSLPYDPANCGATLTFTNNGYHILGTLNTGCSTDGTVTIDFP